MKLEGILESLAQDQPFTMALSLLLVLLGLLLISCRRHISGDMVPLAIMMIALGVGFGLGSALVSSIQHPAALTISMLTGI